MENNVITIAFAEDAKAYQALSDLKRAAVAGQLEVTAAAVVQRNADGQFSLKDGVTDGSASGAAVTGTLIGSLVGILAGPLGMLLGASSGALMGTAVGLDKATATSSVIEQMMRAVPNGASVLVAQVQEASPEALDKLVQGLGGVIVRRPAEAVLAEVEAEADARDAAAKEARKVLRAKQRDEWKDKIDEWTDEIGDKLDDLQKSITDLFKGKKG